MLITPAELRTQFERAHREWPFIEDIAAKHDVPKLLLFALGSRETNLTNERGDGGHGHGVFQLDDRYHPIPTDFDKNVVEQTRWAASMIAANLRIFNGHIHPAICAYNCGPGNAQKGTGVLGGIKLHGDPDYFTTHSSGIGYGVEVLARWHFLRTNFGWRAERKK